MRDKDALGKYGERLAARCLSERGLRLIETNWRCARGEIDIIAAEGDVLVICEVKTRSSAAYGSPASAVGPVKQARIRALASLWLSENPGRWRAVRFDVISVRSNHGGPAEVAHLKAAF